MKTKHPMLKLLPVLLGILFLGTACVNTKVIVDQERAEELITEPFLVITPVAQASVLQTDCKILGRNFQVEIPKRVKGSVVYSGDIEGLQNRVSWDSMIKNGKINVAEATAMAKAVGCPSAVTVRVINFNRYPPFQMVVEMLWIDAETGNIVGTLYNDVDISDSMVHYRYNNFAGQGPMKELYEEFAYSADRKHTAYLSLESFKVFVAAFSSAIMFDDVGKVPWWYFWRILG